VALELPGWLVNVFYVIGLPWPGIDEDELRAWAQSVREFADDVTSNAAGTHQAVADLAATTQSSSVGALADRWEQHSQLVAALHGPMNVFADALDVAAYVVEGQKDVVIGAATLLAFELLATEIDAVFTFGLDEGAVPAEIISTREIVKAALEFLEAELIGKLISIALEDVADHLNHFLGEFFNVALPVAGEVAGITMAYNSVRDVAQQARAQAAGTEETGYTAYLENASRDIEDAGERGDAFGDGGAWAVVVQRVEQGLLYIAEVLFRGLSEAISEIQEATAAALDRTANLMEDADQSLGRDFQRFRVPDEVPLRVRGGEPGRVVPDLELAKRDDWKVQEPRLITKQHTLLAEHLAPPEAPLTTFDDADLAVVQEHLTLTHQIGRELVTPVAERIRDEDPRLELLGKEDKRFKELDRTLVKIEQFQKEQGLPLEEAAANVRDGFRFSYGSSEEHYTDAFFATERRWQDEGFVLVERKNLWTNPKARVNGINSTWMHPETGRLFEIQFHTPISFRAVTEVTHEAFERARLSIPEGNEALITGRTAMNEFHFEVKKLVPVPPGVDEIKDYKLEEPNQPR
jgi:hypothetical protein